MTPASACVSGGDALNKISTHRRPRSAVRQLLGTGSLTLLQSEAWSKSPAPSWLPDPKLSYSNSDQRMHMDYPNHYLTHPAPWDSPEAVAAILYFDHEEECGGATR